MESESVCVVTSGLGGYRSTIAEACDRLSLKVIDQNDTGNDSHTSTVLVYRWRSVDDARIDALCRQWREEGYGAVLVIVPLGARDVRSCLLQRSFVEVISPRTCLEEVTHRLGRMLKTMESRARMHAQDQELALLTALTRRVIRPVNIVSLIGNALSSAGSTLSLHSASVLVLASVDEAAGDVAEAITWREEGGVEQAEEGLLEKEDIEALRRREPVVGRSGMAYRMTLPLASRGTSLGVLRVESHTPIGERLRNRLHQVGVLIAAAIENSRWAADLVRKAGPGEAIGSGSDRQSEQQRELFQSVIDTLPVSLHVIDRTFRVMVWNRGREAGPFGRPRGEVLGCNLFSVIGEDAALREEYEQVFATGVSRVVEIEGRAGDPPRVYRVEKVPMRLGEGRDVSHVITFARDVTEERAMERSLAQTDKMAAVGRLAAGIVHEINNPMATIAGCAEAMRNRLINPLSDEDRLELWADAEVVEEEAYRCKDILESLLDFSRSTPDLETGCDLGDVARRTIRLLRHNRRIAGLELELDIEDDVPQTCGNEDQLVQVLLALLFNAADATSAGGHVRIRVARGDEGSVMLSVEDDGPGIPPEVRERIFEPFFTTKPPGKGTGLGLAVVYGIVQSHEGRMEVISLPGLGTRFDVILPEYRSAADAERKEDEVIA